MIVRFPDAEDPAGGVGDDRHPARRLALTLHGHHWCDDLPTSVGGRACHGICIVHADVCGPDSRDRGAIRNRSDAGDGLIALHAHCVVARILTRLHGLPAEQIAVEVDGGILIGCHEVNPGWRAS